MQPTETQKPRPLWLTWMVNFLKGMLIGTGAILPGISGGVLAVIVGVYGRMIAFLADLRKDFWKNVRFFIPIALGMGAGIVGLSGVVNRMLESSEAQVIWLFIGCVVGTMPQLYREAGEKGRGRGAYAALGAAFVIAFAILSLGEDAIRGQMPANLWTFMLCGAVMALGSIVPGMSPSNFLLYMGLYGPMTAGISALDVSVIVPLLIGAAACVLLLAKGINALFQRWHAISFHAIFGIIVASTLKIIPMGYSYISPGGLMCLVMLVLGVALGYGMTLLEARFPKEP